MSLLTLPDALINLIFDFCENRTSYSLALSCKTLYDITLQESGFAKSITYDYTNGCDVFTFINRLGKHRRSLKLCSIHRLQNPFYWIPIWTKQVNFYQCKITDSINPVYPVPTEILKITHYVSSEITINWSKFPHLKEIEITNVKVDFKGVENCQKLKRICYFPPIESRHIKVYRRHTINETVLANLKMNDVNVVIGY
jgi:hypothetical protein